MLTKVESNNKKISNTGKLSFVSEVDSIRDEAAKLQASGVNIIIALGHSGYKKDLRIAQVPFVDLVVGAHTHTFLYNGRIPDIEVPRASYPTVVTQKSSGKKVPVVQAYAFTKYLGYLNITFDKDGEVLSWNGNPILLDSSIPQDPQMLAELEAWNERLNESSFTTVVGQTKVFLSGSCRAGECNLGSFFADAMCHGYNYHALRRGRAIPAKQVYIAMINGGTFRTSLGTASQKDKPTGITNITMADVLTLLPFENSINLIEIKGKYLRSALEQSVASSSDVDVKFGEDGKFLQVSGLRITFNMAAPTGHRVQNVDVKASGKKYSLLADETVYRILVNEFIARGGDGYAMLSDNSISKVDTGLKDVKLMVDYIKHKSPIVQTNDGRIVVEAAPTTSLVPGAELPSDSVA